MNIRVGNSVKVRIRRLNCQYRMDGYGNNKASGYHYVWLISL